MEDAGLGIKGAAALKNTSVQQPLSASEDKKELYERYRSYFTCRGSEACPGNDIFIIVREGMVSWLTRREPLRPAAFSPRPAERDRCQSELVDLLAKIITKEVLTNGT